MRLTQIVDGRADGGHWGSWILDRLGWGYNRWMAVATVPHGADVWLFTVLQFGLHLKYLWVIWLERGCVMENACNRIVAGSAADASWTRCAVERIWNVEFVASRRRHGVHTEHLLLVLHFTALYVTEYYRQSVDCRSILASVLCKWHRQSRIVCM